MVNGQLNRVVRHIRKLVGAEAEALLPDRELLDRFLHNKDETAFAALVERHGAMVLGICRRVLNHVQDAEDACQATFLVLARRAGAIRKKESLASWLHGVAFRAAANLKREIARRQVRENAAAAPAGDGQDISWREVRAVLDEELRRLPERFRAPLVLCYLEGKTRDEAARELGWSLGTVKAGLERGRDVLRRSLTRRGLTLSSALLAAVLAEQACAAGLPAVQVVHIVKAGVGIAAGRLPASDLVSARVAALMEGVARTMIVSKLKMTAAIFVAAGVLGLGICWQVADLLAAGSEAGEPQATQTVSQQADEPARTGEPEPAIDPAQLARNKEQSVRNLKALALAMHNYHDAHQHFPAPAIYTVPPRGPGGGGSGGAPMGGATAPGVPMGPGGGGPPGGPSPMPGVGPMGPMGSGVGPMFPGGGKGGAGARPGTTPMPGPAMSPRPGAPGAGPGGGGAAGPGTVGPQSGFSRGGGRSGPGMMPGAAAGGPPGVPGMGPPGGQTTAGAGMRPPFGNAAPATTTAVPATSTPGKRSFPKTTKSLLSWRVAILPFLGENELYNQFKLNEPWDSPHNKKLVKKMPKVFAPPGIATRVPYSTHYQVFVGEHAAFEKHQAYWLGSFLDGTSNVILVVEAGYPVPWTKPEDLHFAADEPLPELGGLFPDLFHAAFADGSVRALSKKADPDLLRKLIMRDDGHNVDIDKVIVKPPLPPLADLRKENEQLKQELKREKLRLEKLRLEKDSLQKHKDAKELLHKENEHMRETLLQSRDEARRLQDEISRLKKNLPKRKSDD